MKSVPKTSAKEMAAAVQASQTVVTQQAVDVPAATPAAPGPSAAPKKKEKDNKKQKKVIRTAGGVTWEDNTLTDWPDGKFVNLQCSISLPKYSIFPNQRQLFYNK